ncbi:zliS Lysozyme family protein [uncultured Caudovirales phage]|uniref:ZliS Lysozyme family protein n=1 Tax=uncultured Caudovirales phage TaxID=2100421 RepID=A0A6J7WSL9_9CAUD|nr:zliS Lysozyme family protein [uncultured Caudovirales phage]CAB5220717.1 zliS Lysozyme family protein [uncultured Caudovirales phage]
MKDNYLACIEVVLKSEGGYVNDPHDPGGDTNFGISKRAYPSVDIKHLTKEGAIAIYKKDYWDRVKGDDLPIGLDLVVLDAAVNSGVSQSVKWLQRSVGVVDDGTIGPKTFIAVAQHDTTKTIEDCLHQRLLFLKGLKNWPRYGKGWLSRLQALHTLATNQVKKK